MNQQTTALTERATGAKVSRTAAKTRPSTESTALAKPANAEERESMIACAAYFRAERRGFAPGAELEDWLQAEQEIERQLNGG